MVKQIAFSLFLSHIPSKHLQWFSEHIHSLSFACCIHVTISQQMYRMRALNSQPSHLALRAITPHSEKHSFYYNRAEHLNFILRFICRKAEDVKNIVDREAVSVTSKSPPVRIRCGFPAAIIPLCPSSPPLCLFGDVFLSACDSAVAERGQSICKRWTQPSFSSSFLLMAIIRRLAAVPETCSSCSPAAVGLLHKASILRGSLGVMPRK